MGLILRSSEIHAVGCYTTATIPAGTKIIEYTGPRISIAEADKRYDGRELTYLFGLDSGEQVIDGHGMAAFINHCCDPNCDTDEIAGRVWIFAARDIASGEELTYDYNLYDGDEDDLAICQCGAANCRGTMYGPRQKKSRKRARKKPVKKAA